VARVLADISPRLDQEKLVEAASADLELSVVQRLGFLLDRPGANYLVKPLASWLSKQRPRTVRLKPDRPAKGASIDRRWSLLLNQTE
jgi:hypothetical protein